MNNPRPSDDTEIEKLIQQIEIASQFALHKSLSDGDPRHHKEMIEQSAAKIKALLLRGKIELLEKLSDKSDTHETPIYGVTNRQIVEEIEQLHALEEGKYEEN